MFLTAFIRVPSVFNPWPTTFPPAFSRFLWQLLFGCGHKPRWVVSLLLPVLISTAWTFTKPTYAAVPIKAMSFNIRFDDGKPSESPNAWIGLSGPNRKELAMEVVAQFGPDILGVQEALHNQIDDLKKALPTHGFYGVGRSDGIDQGEYCGIFYNASRFRCTDQGTFWLNSKPDTPGTFFPETCCARIASWVVLEDLEIERREYFVLNAHWDHEVQAARLFSARLIRDRITSLAGKRPMIVMGDFNATEKNPAMVALTGGDSSAGLVLVDSYRNFVPKPGKRERTFHDFNGGTEGERIDYILHNHGFQTKQAAIVRRGENGRFPSDHFPVTAILVPKR